MPSPQAAALLAVLIPLMEPVGWAQPDNPETLRGYRYTPGAVAAIALSAVLGVAVTLSTFLVIGATSSLTYNVVGEWCTVMGRMRVRKCHRQAGCGLQHWAIAIPLALGANGSRSAHLPAVPTADGCTYESL